MIRAFAGGDEDGGGGGAGGHVGGVPDAGRVDRIVAGAERNLGRAAVLMLLDQGDLARGADHQLGAVRVDFPAVPAFREIILRDEPAIAAVGLVAGGIGLVPVHAGERRLDRGGPAAAEMGEVGGEMGHGVPA